MSTVKSIRKAVSPTKRSSTASQNPIPQQSTRDFNTQPQLADGIKLTKKEVEIEHLKTALYSVSTRLHALKDLEKDVQNSQALVHDSEQKRALLQQHINQSALTLKQDADNNRRYQDELANENNQLREQLAQQKADYDRLERIKLELQAQHLKEIQGIHNQYNSVINQKDLKIKELTQRNLQIDSKVI